jgi:hypothetical protein
MIRFHVQLGEIKAGIEIGGYSGIRQAGSSAGVYIFNKSTT